MRSSIRCVNLRGVGVVLACLSTGGLGGCFSPDLSGGECINCPDNVCPGDMVCRKHYCVDPNSKNSCGYDPPSGGGEGGSGAEAVTGGTGNVEQGGFAAGGTAGHPGSGAEAGEAGSTSPPGPSIEVAPVSLCTTDVSVTLRGSHGTKPYDFEIVGGDSGFALATDGDATTLQGTAAEAGDYSVTVRVTDAEHVATERAVTFHVNETPVVRTTDLPSVCPDEKYDAPLAAEGGDRNDYVFTAEVDPKTQLGVEGDHLRGRFASISSERASIDVEVRVESGGCVSAPVTLQLTQEAATAKACPRIYVASDLPNLPPPCAGSPYLRSFIAQGGEQGYEWASVSVPEGLSFNADSRELSGVPEASGAVTLEVKDATGRTIQSDFELPPAHDKCWLAYLAPSTGTTRLNLFDPLVGNAESFPRDSGADPVLDFKFSPDGRLLAYRTGTGPGAGQLRLLEVRGFREQVLEEQSAGHYAWSDDGSALAFEFSRGMDHFLGGVDVSGEGGAGTDPDYPLLTEVGIPTAVLADPVWFDGSNVGFLIDPYAGYFTLMWTTRTTSSFLEPTFPGAGFYAEGVFLRAAPEGIFVIPDDVHTIAYHGADGSDAVQHDHVLIAPKGNFAAGAVAAGTDPGTLNVFKPESHSFSTLPDIVPEGTQSGCDAILAWANDGRRLMCARARQDADVHADLVVFDVAAGGTVAAPREVKGVYDFPSPGQGQTGLARVFSATGRRFAFATDSALYATPTAAGAATVDLSALSASAPGDDVALAFSPDERFLVEHRGSVLRLFDFEGPSVSTRYLAEFDGESPPNAPACSESLRAPALPALHTPYCGAFNEHLPFAWSSDSRLLAVATTPGHLFVQDLGAGGQIVTTTVTGDCGATCVAGDDFAFQP